MVFLVEFKNKSHKTLRYNPDRTVFSVFDQHLSPAAIETTGIIPANGTALAFFVVSNTTDGRKNKFSADNQWEVIIKTIQERDQ